MPFSMVEQWQDHEAETTRDGKGTASVRHEVGACMSALNGRYVPCRTSILVILTKSYTS